MRPVLLTIDGFASYREPAEVDFTDVDFFALVGPTGSGKSTIIDAITFALYGSAPRWESRSKVSLALAPTTSRGIVRLVFDAAQHRYQVARELRRTTAGVTQRSVRLERFTDPTATGGPEDPTVVLAADSQVTPAVEGLLGLTFSQFNQCVVLPQGKFAEFLQATPADRQKILLVLLGAGRYDVLAREANARARTLSETAQTLTLQLDTYGDVDDDTLATARNRYRQLTRARAGLGGLTATWADATLQLQQAEALVDRLTTERSMLVALSLPVTARAAEGDLATALAAAAAARGHLADAESADTRVREALTAMGDKERHLTARRLHAEHASLSQAAPTLSRAVAQAGETHATASQSCANATAELEVARTTDAAARSEVESAAARVGGLAEQVRALRAVRAPDDLARQAERHRVARAALASAEEELEAAERADAEAKAKLAAAEDPVELAGAIEDLGQISALEAAAAADTELRGAAERALIEASRLLEQARARHAGAIAARDDARRGDEASALRAHLVVGRACPVCEQEVRTLPPVAPDTHLVDHERAVATAAAVIRTAEDRVRGCGQERAAAKARHEATLDHLQTVRLRLEGRAVFGTLAELNTRQQDLTHAQQAHLAGSAAVGAARERRSTALKAVDATEADLKAARTTLARARDPLVALGAPAVDDVDVDLGWARLCSWCATAAEQRDRDLRHAEQTAATSRTSASEAADALRTATGEVESASEALSTAVAALERAREKQRAATVRFEQISASLLGLPSDADAAAALIRIGELEDRASSVDLALRTAREAARAADAAVEHAQDRATVMWKDLRSARDALVPLGAPELPDGSLLAAWEHLVAWASTQASQRDTDLAVATASATASRMCTTKAAGEVREMLAGLDITMPSAAASQDPLDQVALVALVSATEEAKGRVDRLNERRHEAAALRVKIADAKEKSDVANTVGYLLRADQFQRWLVTAALNALVREASVFLAHLSGGQFDLTHSKGEFFVVDHADADSRRSVRTLSGGETFQASLALALALSSQMSALAGPGAARLDSILLDEGFGTLDEATLETVAATLENLAHGDRMVGVVTHVGALADRIPIRFEVSRDQRTSRVLRVGVE